MQWLKAAIIGALAALVMFLLMFAAIQSGMAPFNVPPSAAFLVKLGLPAMPLALIVHFGYGIVWSIILVAVFKHRTSIGRGIGLAMALWLIMMLIYSPIIGWGLFGAADTSNLPAKLQLGSTVKYIVASLVLHLIYGGIIGWLNPVWIYRGSARRADQAGAGSSATSAAGSTAQ